MLACSECRYQEVIERRAPPPAVRWRSPTITKPCAMPECPGMVVTPVSHPTRVKFCGRHTRAERRRASVRVAAAALARLRPAAEGS